MYPKEERKKLKPTGFRGVERSVFASSAEASTTRGTKRQQQEPLEVPEPSNKKPCHGLSYQPVKKMHPPSKTINLANDRLRRLKQSLQIQVDPKQSEISKQEHDNRVQMPTTPKVTTLANERVNRVKRKLSLSDDKHKENCAKTPEDSSKNLFQRIKKVNENYTNSSPNYSDVSTSQSYFSLKSPLEVSLDTSAKLHNYQSPYDTNKINVKKLVKTPNLNLSSRISKIRKKTDEINNSRSECEIETETVKKLNGNTCTKHSPNLTDRLNLHKAKPKCLNFKETNTPIPSFESPTSLKSTQSSSSLKDRLNLHKHKSKCLNFNETNIQIASFENTTSLNSPQSSPIIKDRLNLHKPKLKCLNYNETNIPIASFEKPTSLNTPQSSPSMKDRLNLHKANPQCLNFEETNIPIPSFENPTSLNPRQSSSSMKDRLNLHKAKPQRLNFEETNIPIPSFENPTSLNPQQSSSSMKDRLNLHKAKPQCLNFKETNIPIPSFENPTSLNPPQSSEFLEKMSMTAHWVRSHHSFTEIDTIQDPLLDIENNNNLNNSNSNMDTVEEMDWSNAEPITCTEIKETPQETIETKTKTDKIETVTIQDIKEKFICIVVDTNVFIHDINTVENIINLKVSGSIQPLLYVPWMVITELDEIKDRPNEKKLSLKALNAVRFINRAMSEENPKIRGQSVADMAVQNHIGTSPDDKIIGCCMQAIKKYESVILLSNDLNLRNKAMINSLTAASCNDIITKIMSKLQKNTKTVKIMKKVSMLWSEIIFECAKEAYGDACSKMEMLSNPPWSVSECLKRFKKYWVAVFQEKLLKHFLNAVEKLENILNTNNSICDDSENYVEFVKLCLTMCIYLKDIEESRGSVEKVINDITRMG